MTAALRRKVARRKSSISSIPQAGWRRSGAASLRISLNPYTQFGFSYTLVGWEAT